MSWREEVKINVGRITSLYLGSGLGTLVTAAATTLNKAIAHASTASKRMVWGYLDLGATNFAVVTGLTTVESMSFSFKKATAPSTVIEVSWDDATAAGTIKLYGWKSAAASPFGLIAATSAASVKWIATGT